MLNNRFFLITFSPMVVRNMPFTIKNLRIPRLDLSSCMAIVYILISNRLNKFYIGSCKNLSERFTQHANKMFVKSFTTKADDWELYLSITDLSYQQARLIELHIKKMKSTQYIKDLIKYPQIIEKLKERYS